MALLPAFRALYATTPSVKRDINTYKDNIHLKRVNAVSVEVLGTPLIRSV